MTPIQVIKRAFEVLSPTDFSDWLASKMPYLLEIEKQQIVDAWIRGNEEGWAMTTDWPGDGERYYDKMFGKK
jgi:hypothetical protein